MKNDDPHVSIIDSIFTEAVNRKIFHLIADDAQLNGRTTSIAGKPLINFSSCSYLGLELDPRLCQGAIDAIQRYGTQFSSSRACISAPQYKEVEALFSQLFDAHVAVAATTTLGHFAVLPVLIAPKDAVIMDLQVHNSVQLAVTQCRLKGSPVEIIRHNRMDSLEEMIKNFRDKGARKIWYLADGIYSMYGDLAPLTDIISLLDKYDNFYVYIDDAHGFSWTGRNGRGYVLGQKTIHPKMVVVASLAKAFGVGGGIIVFPNYEWYRKVRNCGGTFIFAGPLQPALLGAAIASLKIHLSGEIHPLQTELLEKINYCTQLLQERNLPLLCTDATPIRFIGLGLMNVACNVVQRLMQEGYYASLATFPAVPIKRSGIRIAINRHLTKQDIKGLVDALSYHLPLALEEENYTLNFAKTFGDILPNKNTEEFSTQNNILLNKSTNSNLQIIYETTIKNIPKSIWDRYMEGRGPFTWDAVNLIEKVYINQPELANNWKFHYYLIKDQHEQIVLLTFFISAICKDDVFSPGSVSEKIEKERERRNDPYYLCSKSLLMGSLFSEGNHLYLDKSRDWQGALKLLIEHLGNVQEKEDIQNIIFRDLPGDDVEFDHFMLQQGYIKISLPDTHIIENNYPTYAELIQTLPKDKRRFIKKEILERESLYRIEILDHKSRMPSQRELDWYYQLYQNIKEKNFDINIFEIPKNIFSEMLSTPIWEIMTLYFKDKIIDPDLPVAIFPCLKTPTTYCPLIIGLDYNYVKTYGAYRQILYQVIKRGFELGAKETHIGLTTSLQKRRLGAVPYKIAAYFQAADTFNMEVLAHMNVDKIKLVD